MNEFKLSCHKKIKTKILICYVNVIIVINIPENNNIDFNNILYVLLNLKLIKNSEYIINHNMNIT